MLIPWYRKRRRLIALVILVFATSHAVADESVNKGVVVIANSNVPESLELAKYYLTARHIPAENLCLLDLPEGEIISREFYNQKLRDPLLDFLRKQKLVKQVGRNPDDLKGEDAEWETIQCDIKYLVPVYGVPVKIADTRFPLSKSLSTMMGKGQYRDEASVDSELALILSDTHRIESAVNNMFYGAVFAMVSSEGKNTALLVSRLDGPKPDDVKRMIDDALYAERYGLLGRMYFDARAIRDPHYVIGDYWIRESYERFMREGYECYYDKTPDLLNESYPMENAVLYFGWYAEHVQGPFLQEGFRFAPGAIAYHLHSASAKRLRTGTRYWTGPLIRAGAAASMGTVAEPYLTMTPRLDMYSDRLCMGRDNVSAAFMSQNVLSWQTVIVGDPLYAPCRYTLDEQIQHLKEDGRPEVEWAYLRKVNLMVRNGVFNPALDYCRKKIDETDSLVLREKLGDLYAKNQLYADAALQYNQVLNKTTSVVTAMRVGARQLLLLRLTNRSPAATELEKDLRKKWKDSPLLEWLKTAAL